MMADKAKRLTLQISEYVLKTIFEKRERLASSIWRPKLHICCDVSVPAAPAFLTFELSCQNGPCAENRNIATLQGYD
jgi:hypothetical protein